MDKLETSSAKAACRQPLSLRNSALGLLARREHSRKELQQKLERKVSTEDDKAAIPTLLDKLTEQGLLSDERFTEAYVNMRARKGYGPTRIALELAERGINAELTQTYLNSQHDWRDIIKAAWQKKFGQLPLNYAEKARQMRFLHSRGFSGEAIGQLFDELQADI